MRRERGFSLPEVLMALMILTLVILTSLAVFTERTRRLQQATETMLAWQAIANEAEVWRRKDFAFIKPEPERSFDTETPILAPLKPFKTRVLVQERTATVKEVTLVVQWHDDEREARLLLIRTHTGGTNLW